MSNGSNNDKPSKKEVLATFSIVAIFFLAIALVLAVIFSILDSQTLNTIAKFLQALAFAIAVSVIAINSVDVAKKMKSKFWFWSWIICIIICVIYIVFQIVKAFQ
ncbi:MAG: hypothetical protein FWD76_02650 [Firmicutes bacterium]|nr:hypothetical protein [Bacillota bacterium]